MRDSLDPLMLAALEQPSIRIAFLLAITFRSGPRYAWTGPGPLSYNGNTYLGVGSLGSVGDISGGIDVQAQGTSVTLSGIDQTYLDESLNDIQVGAPAKISWVLTNMDMTLVSTPYVAYAGTVDVPTINMGTKTSSITLKIENRMIDLQRAQCQRYTSAYQHVAYPDDTAFNWVEQLSDAAFKEGQA